MGVFAVAIRVKGRDYRTGKAKAPSGPYRMASQTTTRRTILRHDATQHSRIFTEHIGML